MEISTHPALESQARTASRAQAPQAPQAAPAAREARRGTNSDAQDPRPTHSAAPARDAARLNESDLSQVQELEARDREVRAHEQAHVAAGGSLVRSGASYTYQQGPDGKRYAVGGEVQIDTARVAGDPEATAERAEQVRRAALAPATPSAQDRAVAAQAAAMAAQARAEAAQARQQDASAGADSKEQEATADETVPVSPRDGAGSRTHERPEIGLYESVAAIEDEPPRGGDRATFVTA